MRDFENNFRKYFDKEITHLQILEGGFALSHIFFIERKFSYDIDFTVDSAHDMGMIINRYKDLLNISQINREGEFVRIALEDENIRNLDYYIVPRVNYFFEEKKFGGVSILVHTIEDIFVEKICCLYTRNTISTKDIKDIRMIIDKGLILNKRISSIVKLKLCMKSIKKRLLLTKIVNIEELRDLYDFLSKSDD